MVSAQNWRSNAPRSAAKTAGETLAAHWRRERRKRPVTTKLRVQKNRFWILPAVLA